MDLPYEVLVYLFKYLNSPDRFSAGETCRLWYQAANDNFFLKRKYAVFYRIPLNTNNSPLKLFENSVLNYTNFEFIEVEISNELRYFWKNTGAIIKYLTLSTTDICEKTFVYIIQKCPNLEVLKIEHCRELFMSGCLLEGKTEGLLAENLEHLKSLSLAGNTYLSDALFNRFVASAPKLEEINLSSCSIQFHLGLVKKFYPPGVEVLSSPSESVLTFYFVLKFIETRAKTIKGLHFSNTLIDGAALQSIAEVPDLKLEYLSANTCDQMTNTGILALCTQHTSLKVLDIGSCTRVTDQSLLCISTHLINLENLNIQRCRAVTDLGIAELCKLKKLKSLDISQCELITKAGIEKGICPEINLKLTDLDINSLNIDESTIIMMSERLPNLRMLNVSFCFNAVTDVSIQMIFKNQLKLCTLKMSHCDKVSDLGLTGMGRVKAEVDYKENIDSGFLQACGSQQRIHLGSRAEEEIVRDARRKQDVRNLCERITTDTCAGYSMTRLVNLRALAINGCNRITDVSLTYAFKLKELFYLNLSNSHQITHHGIEHLAQNCPSLEYLKFNYCFNLNDEAVTVICKHLPRLTHLELKGCGQLTDKSLDAIKFGCNKLKKIDLEGCVHLSADLAYSLACIPTLHTIGFSQSTTYREGSIETTSKPKEKSLFFPAILKRLKLGN